MIDHSDYLKISGYILNKTGIKITDENINSVKRFVFKKLNKNISIKKYLYLLDNDELEFHELIKNSTIHETYFFREEKYFKLLNETILPEYKQNRAVPPVIWSAAAASGEEAVSLALLLNKHWNIISSYSKYTIATDIDLFSLHHLEKRIYKKNSFRNDGKLFHNLIYINSEETKDGIRINEKIINMIEFKKINLIKDDYGHVLRISPDIIFLCNVLIYMEKEIRDNVINKTVKILNEGGYLFVSSSNTAFITHPLLTLKNNGCCYYFKKLRKNSE